MTNNGFYADKYAEFLARRAEATGYDFGRAPVANVPPPTVTFAEPLRWWSLDRPRRLAAILALRDRLQDEILALARGARLLAETSEVKESSVPARERNVVSRSERERAVRARIRDVARAA